MTDEASRRLLRIKIVHTVAWAFFAGCIIGILVFASIERRTGASILCGLVFVEVLILAFNDWRCPLTPMAARYTADRRPNFDIFLPEWLARWNKEIFGTLYLGGLIWVAFLWLG